MSRLADQLHQNYNDQEVLILGWGREGQSTYQFLRQACPDIHLTISDQNVDALNAWQTEHGVQLTTVPYLSQLSNFTTIFKSPGVPTLLSELQDYLDNGGKITSQLNEFLWAYRNQTTGVTGTKGKSTTSSLIAALTIAAGKPTLFAGNIGKPVFDIVDQVTPDTEIVIEMSSYQLDSVTISPRVAVFLNFFPEHLNYHQSIGNYLAAKAKITEFQTEKDTLIYNQDSPEVRSVAESSRAQLVPFSYLHEMHYPESVHRSIAELEGVELPATIKKWNILPALLATSSLNLTVERIIDVLKKFQPLPHRLETVGHFGGLTWIDDTLATIPEATIAALESLPRVDVLMLGGFDRGISYDKIVEACMTKKVPAIAFFKPSGQTMYDLLRQHYPEASWPHMEVVDSMEQAVKFAYAQAPKDGVVLLSPSSPSFGQFKDYEDKSAQFKALAEQLAPAGGTAETAAVTT